MSSAPPPSYTTEDRPVRDIQSSSGSLTRRKSSKEKAKDDSSSVSRRRSRRHSSHDPKLSQEIIERIARQSVRSSRHINADLLKQIAKEGGLPKHIEHQGLPKFKVITGSEANRVYRKTLQEDDRLSHDSTKRKGSRHFETRPIVFAYPGIRAGRKVVDYYMTWRGKTPKAHRLKGPGRRTDILDGEFKNLSKTLDEYGKKVKRLSNLVSTDPTTPKASTFSVSPSVLTNGDVDTAVEPTRPTPVQVESAPAVLTTTVLNDNDPLPPPRPPYARNNSNGSAVSLPYLGERLQLVVANPDASSSSGQDSRRSSVVGESSKPFKDKSSPLKQVLTAVEEEEDDANSITSSKKQSIRESSDSKHHRRQSSNKEGGRDSSKSPASSSESLSGANSDRKQKEDGNSKEDEILIVLMDDKESSWHGLAGRRDSKKESIVRRESQRASPWSGPVANSWGEIHRFVPGGGTPLELTIYDPERDHREDPDTDNDLDDDDGDDEDTNHAYDVDDNLILSLKARLTALGLHTPSHTPKHTPTQTPPIHTPSAHSSRALTLPPYLVNSPYLHPSPATLSGRASLHYSSPYSISAPNLPLPALPPPPPASEASSYVLPFVSDDATAAAIYSSPYAPPTQLQLSYSNSQAGAASAVGAYTPMSSSAVGLYAQSPGGFLGTGMGMQPMPLPAVSAYPSSQAASSPYMGMGGGGGLEYEYEYEYAAHPHPYAHVQATPMDPTLYPLPPSLASSASYSSPYAVPLRAQTPPY